MHTDYIIYFVKQRSRSQLNVRSTRLRGRYIITSVHTAVNKKTKS